MKFGKGAQFLDPSLHSAPSLATDSSGNVIPGSAGGGGVPPLLIAAGSTFTALAGQTCSVIPTVVDGCLRHDGAWVKNP